MLTCPAGQKELGHRPVSRHPIDKPSQINLQAWAHRRSCSARPACRRRALRQLNQKRRPRRHPRRPTGCQLSDVRQARIDPLVGIAANLGGIRPSDASYRTVVNLSGKPDHGRQFSRSRQSGWCPCRFPPGYSAAPGCGRKPYGYWQRSASPGSARCCRAAVANHRFRLPTPACA